MVDNSKADKQTYSTSQRDETEELELDEAFELLDITIQFRRLSDNAQTPSYAKPGDAGFDLMAVAKQTLQRGIPTAVPTGLAVAVPEGFEIQIRSRSGNSLKGLVVNNSPGTIDSGYRGELKVILLYQGPNYVYTIQPGDKIAQGVLAPVFRAGFEEVDELSESDRGTNGFGSTGR